MLTFPLTTGQFINRLRVTSQTFDLEEPYIHSATRGGAVLRAANADPFWRGQITTAPTYTTEGRQVRSLIDALRGVNGSFYVRDRTYFGPQEDPNGAVLANRKLAIAAVEPTRIKIGFLIGATAQQGYPPELALRPGDMISVLYALNPFRWELLRVAPNKDGYYSAGGGVSEWIDVVPLVRRSIVGYGVTLYQPRCKAVLMPETVQGGQDLPGGRSEGWSFSWRQTQ